MNGAFADRERALAALSWLARLGLAGMFLYAGALKFAEPAVFAQDISNYRALPDAVVPAAAVALPIVELVAGIALLTRPYAQGGATLSAVMLAVFAGAMAQAKLRGIDLECGCFGAASTAQVSWAKVASNFGLAILSLWIAWTTRPKTPAAAAPPSAQPT